MSIPLREKKVGPYTVRELPMRETMRILEEYPDENVKGIRGRGPAMLGAAVFNGSGEPLGLAVLDLGTGLYTQLMAAYGEVTGEVQFPQDEQGNV